MNTEAKNLGGRPPKPEAELLVQKSVRMTPAQWAKVDENGGQTWLRELVAQAKPPKKKPAK